MNTRNTLDWIADPTTGVITNAFGATLTVSENARSWVEEIATSLNSITELAEALREALPYLRWNPDARDEYLKAEAALAQIDL